MIKRVVTVSESIEERENSVAEIVKLACSYNSEIQIFLDNMRINAKSIMGVMAAYPFLRSNVVTVAAEGCDENEAFPAMENYLHGGEVQAINC